jgi:phage gp36-like protein
MSQFITPEDYDASIHREILDALLRHDSDVSDSAIVEICEDRAIAEMRGYLDKFYDTDAIFDATGSDRNQLVLMMAVDIAVYHIFCQHNPYKISEIRKERYNRAIEWLKAVAAGKITIANAPRLPEEEAAAASPWQLAANELRPSHL